MLHNITNKTPHTHTSKNQHCWICPGYLVPVSASCVTLRASAYVFRHHAEPLYRAYLPALSCLFVSESPRRKQPLSSLRELDSPVLPAPVPDHTGPARATLEQSTVNRTALASSSPSDQQVAARSPSDWTACLTFKRPLFLPEDPQISLDFPLFRTPTLPPPTSPISSCKPHTAANATCNQHLPTSSHRAHRILILPTIKVMAASIQFERDLRSANQEFKRGKDASVKWSFGTTASPPWIIPGAPDPDSENFRARPLGKWSDE